MVGHKSVELLFAQAETAVSGWGRLDSDVRRRANKPSFNSAECNIQRTHRALRL